MTRDREKEGVSVKDKAPGPLSSARAGRKGEHGALGGRRSLGLKAAEKRGRGETLCHITCVAEPPGQRGLPTPALAQQATGKNSGKPSPAGRGMAKASVPAYRRPEVTCVTEVLLPPTLLQPP